MNRPQTNHHQGKSGTDIIKASSLPINQFSEELIAQLKFSENLIADDDENAFLFQKKMFPGAQSFSESSSSSLGQELPPSSDDALMHVQYNSHLRFSDNNRLETSSIDTRADLQTTLKAKNPFNPHRTSQQNFKD